MDLKEYGIIAEDAALLYLKQLQFTILARNIKFYGVEIDILCKKQDIYFLFEIKRVKKLNYRSGYLAFSHKQQNRYKNAMIRWYTDIQKVSYTSIGLIVYDEHLNILDFYDNLFFS